MKPKPIHPDPRLSGFTFQGVQRPGKRPPRLRSLPPRQANSAPAGPSGDRAPAESTAAIPPAEAAFLRQVLAAAGLDLQCYRLAPLARRIPACLRALRTPSVDQAVHAITHDPRQLTVALNSLVIGVTGFFRDPPVFHDLRSTILPQLLQLRRPHPLRIWSVACSDGCELYSIALLLADRSALRGATLLGTDCRPDAAEAARRAVYTAAAVAEIPVDFLAKYFHANGHSYTLAPQIRSAARWAVADVFDQVNDHNVAHRSSRWDLILCRNLAIYLTSAAVASLWARVAAVLEPGGVLVVGKAERPSAPGLTRLAPCIYRKE